ncbi:MAG: hypothetical protein LBE84_12145 [Planctomycetota bacterium]|jgi:hypothetical protein|nr:hypothetical protein [Planctomycetota bacterium]
MMRLAKPARSTLFRHSAAIVAFLTFFPIHAGQPGTTERRLSPLDRRFRLEIWGGNLTDAIQGIKAGTGVETLVYPPDFPDGETSGLYLTTGRVKLGTVLDGLARRYSFRYRVAGPNRIEISRSYDWVANVPILRFIDLDPVLRGRESDPTRIEEFLKEFVKSLPLLPGDDYSLTVERYSVRTNLYALRAVAVLPPPLVDYLERVVDCLGGAAGDFPGGMDSRLFARANRYADGWPSLLEQRVIVASGLEPKAFLSEIAQQTGIAVLLDVDAPPDALSFPGVAESEMSLGRFAAELAPRLKARKRLFLASGAVLFEPVSPNGEEMELDGRAREMFWTGLAVAGFSIDRTLLSPEKLEGLASRIRRSVFPGLWNDPATALAVDPWGTRLIVVAPVNVLPAIAEMLASLSR